MRINFNTIDHRLNIRASFCFKKMLEKPSDTFPKIFSTTKELLGFYRFMNNNSVDYKSLFDSIKESTLTSCCSNSKKDDVIVAHDTTKFNPRSTPSNLHAHCSLLINGDTNRSYVYGLSHIHLWDRKDGADKGKEHRRWFNGVEETEKSFATLNLIHTMDREGDSYHNLSNLQFSNYRFVIRACTDRKLLNDEKLFTNLKLAPIIAKREVRISAREKSNLPKKNSIHPARKSREVKLTIKATEVKIKRSEWLVRQGFKNNYPESITLNTVLAVETNPPQGEKPISWCLLTSEPISTPEEVLRIIDIYRKRWMIEEYFKALKTGCKVEQRQFENISSWIKSLVMFLQIATQILNLRELDNLKLKEAPNILSKIQLKILQKLAKIEGRQLHTIQDIKLELAKLGGHIKTNGPPGWIVLARGLEDLIVMERAWLIKI